MLDALASLMTPWSAFYGDHPAVSSAIKFLHLAAMLIGGGTALAVDRLVIGGRRDADRRSRALAALGEAHRVVIPSLIVAGVTGGLMLGADVETFFSSPTFGAKAAAIVALAINGDALRRAENTLRRTGGDAAWRRLHLTAGLSTGLWLLVLLLAVRLAYS